MSIRILSGSRWTLVAGLMTLVAESAQAQDQMQMDVADCQRIATQSTGQNPAQAPAQSTAPPAGSPPAGGRVRGAAVGAAAGAARAEVRGGQYQAYDKLPDDAKQDYRQNEARSAAAAGVVVGGARQRQQRREQATAQEQQAAQADAAATAYQQAYNACMQGRGYSP